MSQGGLFDCGLGSGCSFVGLGGGFFVDCAVLGFGSGSAFFDSFEHLSEGGFIHRGEAFATDSLEQAANGGVVEDEPVAFGGDVDISEADLLGGELELGSAVRTFALFDEAFFVEKEEATANHNRALCELFRDCC